MKQAGKRALSFLLVLTMLLGMMTAITVGAEEGGINSFYYANAVADITNRAGNIGGCYMENVTVEGREGVFQIRGHATNWVAKTERFFDIPSGAILWETGATYTISMKAKASFEGSSVYPTLNASCKITYNGATSGRNGSGYGFEAKSIGTDWTDVSWTFKTTQMYEALYSSVAVDSVNANVPMRFYLADGASTIQIDDLKIEKQVAPVVDSASIDGVAQLGRTLTANAVVSDKNTDDTATATYQWQVKNTDWENISGATAQSYTIPNDESFLGKQIRVVVTPVSNNQPSPGTSFEVNPTNAIGAYTYPPTGTNLNISGTKEIGQKVTASYTYVPSASNIPLAETQFIWETSANGEDYTPVRTATVSGTEDEYTIRVADAGRYLRVRVIPVDEKGVETEDALVSEATMIEGNMVFYVSNSGDDSNAGSLDAPFKTIEKARDTIRELDTLPEGGIVVNIMGGTYEISDTISFTEEDSGTEISPVVYQAYNGQTVSFVGGKTLDSSKIAKVTDTELLDGLVEEEAKDHLYMLDLTEQGVTMDALQAYGWTPAGTSGYVPYQPMRIYMNDNVLTEARWPNDDQSQNYVECRPLTSADGIDEDTINTRRTPIMYEYPDPDNRSAKWNITSGDAYVGGAIVYHWATDNLLIDYVDAEKKIVKSLSPHLYASVKGTEGMGKFQVYFSNIFAEIDKPGESYIDRKNGILYFYPVGTMENPEIVVSTLKKNMISVKDASYITFRGIDFMDTVETPVLLDGCNHVTFSDADISNTSAGGVEMVNCKHSKIEGCHIYSTSYTGITVKGGDRENLTHSGNIIENNFIHNVSLMPEDKNSLYAIAFDGCVGDVAQYNEIDDLKYNAIRMSESNDITIQYNKISNAEQLNTDAGAIYWGREQNSLGHVVRYNYFENIGSTMVANLLNGHHAVSVYTDDGSTGGKIYGNVFLNGGTKAGGNGSATIANGAEFSDVWGNISISTEPNRMNKSFLMRNWPATDKFTEFHGVTIPEGTAVSHYLYHAAIRDDNFGGTNSAEANHGREYLWKDSWIEHYEDDYLWGPALEQFSKEKYDNVMALYNAGDYAGVLTYLSTNLLQERTNTIHDNVSLGATTMDSLAKHYDNYSGTEGTITAEDKALFVDFDNKDFTLAPGALEIIHAAGATEFEAIPFSEIGLKTNVGGSKPVAVAGDVGEIEYRIGNTITASYSYSDADGDVEGNTKIYWYKSDTANGTYEQIYGVEGKDFTVTSDYNNSYIKYQIVPYDATMLRGDDVWSEAMHVADQAVYDILYENYFVENADKTRNLTIRNNDGDFAFAYSPGYTTGRSGSSGSAVRWMMAKGSSQAADYGVITAPWTRFMDLTGLEWETGETYTLSFWAKSTGKDIRIKGTINCAIKVEGFNKENYGPDLLINHTVTKDEWKQYSTTFKIEQMYDGTGSNTAVDSKVASVVFRMTDFAAYNTLLIDDLKVTKDTVKVAATVNIEGGENGTVAKDGTTVQSGTKYEVESGDTLTLNVAPKANYTVSVKQDGTAVEVGEDGNVTFTVTADTTINVSFEKIKKTAAVTIKGEGGTVKHGEDAVTNGGTIKVDLDGTLTLSVTPDEGQVVYAVTVDGAAVELDENNQFTVTMDADKAIIVTFVPEGTIYYNAFDTATDTGALTNLIQNLGGSTFATVEDAAYGTIRAIKFDERLGKEGVQRTFDIPAASVTWEKGTTYTMSYMAKATYETNTYPLLNFQCKLAEVAGNYNTYSLETQNIGTEWTKVSYTFTIADLPDGAESVNGAVAWRHLLPAKPASRELSEYIYIQDISIVKKETATATVTINGKGGTVKNGDKIVENGSQYYVIAGKTLTLNVVPDEGYSVLVTQDGTAVEADGNEYTFTVSADTAINVSFERIYKTATVTISGNGTVKKGEETVTSGDEIKVAYGDTLTLNVAPNNGYEVAVTQDGIPVEPNADGDVIFTINEDTEIEVIFTEIPEVAAGIVQDASFNISSIIEGVPTILIYSQMNMFNTDETVAYGIKLWNAADPEKKVTLNARDIENGKIIPAVSKPGTRFAIKVFGEAIKGENTYVAQPFVGSVSANEIEVTFPVTE